jgi:dolichol-phosphate mannosyltransferase
MNRILVFIPTYNEVDNVGPMCEQIMALPLPLDLHFTDDNSPDGTGQKLDELAGKHPRMTVSHRTGKLGIGTAHQAGIAYAYAHGYDWLITLDCDFSHTPQDIPKFYAEREQGDIVVGSRYMQENSLPGWSLFRSMLTRFGHFLTRHLLRMKYDATGAFRLYNLQRIPPGLFGAVRSKSYSFFFESLFVLSSNGFRVKEIPIVLPSRTYGHSKLSFKEAFRSAMFLFKLSLERTLNPGRFRAGRLADRLQPGLQDPQNWSPYWREKKEVSGFIYEMIAAFYRNLVLRPIVRNQLRSTFQPGDRLMHAGCGSGQVDEDLHGEFKITAVDISQDALDLYSRNNPDVDRIEQASILALPYEGGSYDGIYNLGVVEHFTHDEIAKILSEFHRVLKPSGKIVIFWPHRHATSVYVLNTVHRLARLSKSKMKLHPDEISLLESRKQAEAVLARSNFDLVRYRMDLRDGFIQAVLVGQKRG